MDRDISLDAIKLVACIFVCTLHTIGMFMSESSDFHLSYLLFYMSGIAVPKGGETMRVKVRSV